MDLSSLLLRAAVPRRSKTACQDHYNITDQLQEELEKTINRDPEHKVNSSNCQLEQRMDATRVQQEEALAQMALDIVAYNADIKDTLARLGIENAQLT